MIVKPILIVITLKNEYSVQFCTFGCMGKKCGYGNNISLCFSALLFNFFSQADMLTIYVEFEAPRQKGWINSSRSKLGLIQNLFPSLLKALIFLNIFPKKFPILCCGIHQRLSYETFAFARPEKGKIELTNELCISVKLIIFKEYSSLYRNTLCQ